MQNAISPLHNMINRDISEKRIDGKRLAQEHEGILQDEISTFQESFFHMHIVEVGENPVIAQFVRMKKRMAQRIGVEFHHMRYREDISQDDLIQEIKKLNDICVQSDAHQHGIVIQLPLPDHINTKECLDAVDINYDVDVLGQDAYMLFKKGKLNAIPPVARSVEYMLETLPDTVIGSISDMRMAIIGRGRLVGLPIYDLFMQKNSAQIDVIDKETSEEEKMRILKGADIVITGAGVPHLVTADMIKQGAILIDAGTSESQGVLLGDIHPDCYSKASYFTPVPGGVGPLTVVMLYENLVGLAQVHGADEV